MDALHGKHVLVIGFARQGQALARWLPTIGASVTVTDGKTAEQLGINPTDYPSVTWALGESADTLLDTVDVLCVSGGVALSHPLIQAAYDRDMPITNDAQIFVERCPAPVYGVTGSAGKTTTTTLIGQMIENAGYKTWVGGNIGNVLLDALPNIQPADKVVIELSSFQLELFQTSPQNALVLNITPNHLDRHGTMEAYTAAKANILLHQSSQDRAVLGYDDSGSYGLREQVRGDLAWFSADSMVSDGAFLMGERLMLVGSANPTGGANVILERGEIPLRGEHNVRNVLAACALVGNIVPLDVMTETIRQFKGVEHRLEVVRVLDGVTYVNDSIATAPERVMAALKSYSEPLILLLGGADKKLPWDEMLALALKKSRHIVAFGGSAAEIVQRTLTDLNALDRMTRVTTLEEAVAVAHQRAQAGDVVLLSPGGTSYDAYADFAARGAHFRERVNGL
ncbi:MAG: UDP-N-acetylmuramoyl-L-alanine--D-glutamate ligase [Phototrophicaceae bacterium]